MVMGRGPGKEKKRMERRRAGLDRACKGREGEKRKRNEGREEERKKEGEKERNEMGLGPAMEEMREKRKKKMVGLGLVGEEEKRVGLGEKEMGR